MKRIAVVAGIVVVLAAGIVWQIRALHGGPSHPEVPQTVVVKDVPAPPRTTAAKSTVSPAAAARTAQPAPVHPASPAGRAEARAPAAELPKPLAFPPEPPRPVTAVDRQVRRTVPNVLDRQDIPEAPLKLGTEMPRAGIDGSDPVAFGRMLFTHPWTPHDKLCPSGDGLGPVFNARSCVSCHNQGGIGGAGGADRNVELVELASWVGLHPGDNPNDLGAPAGPRFAQPQTGGKSPAKPRPIGHPVPLKDAEGNMLIARPFKDRKTMELTLRIDLRIKGQEKPALLSANLVAPEGFVLHREGTGAGYAKIRAVLAAILKEHHRLSGRNPSAIFGAGLINRISDAAIRDLQKQQKSVQGETVVGRLPVLASGQLGRFGWKAQTASLADFTDATCASDLGLTNPGRAQAPPLNHPAARPPGLDLTLDQTGALVEFEASLPRPRQVLPRDPTARGRVATGAAVFKRIGCDACHTRKLADVDGLYSDLLLHDLGPALASEPVSSFGVPPATGGLFGAFDAPDRVFPTPSEWRTPPLWGVADSAPYLHDGRAKTLAEAIRLHGGQAAASAKRFRTLPDNDQDCLLEFLKSLRAPQPGMDGVRPGEPTPTASRPQGNGGD